MDFKNSYRVEAVYFQKLKSDIDIAKSYIAAGATDEARAVLENLVDVDGAVLLLYRNIGECWAELANAIEKTKKELDALRDQQEQYHDELNEKIDEINNYIIRLINALDERLTAAEADIDDLQERMLAAESDIDDLEANKQDKLTAGFGIEIDANNEISVDTDDVQEKLIAGQNITLTPDSTDPTKTVIDATGGANYSAGFGIEIDANNKISVDTSDVQEKLSAGFGIDIDANNEISVDTNDVQEKLIAGQNITLTPDATDPTKTVIDSTLLEQGEGIRVINNKIVNGYQTNGVVFGQKETFKTEEGTIGFLPVTFGTFANMIRLRSVSNNLSQDFNSVRVTERGSSPASYSSFVTLLNNFITNCALPDGNYTIYFYFLLKGGTAYNELGRSYVNITIKNGASCPIPHPMGDDRYIIECFTPSPLYYHRTLISDMTNLVLDVDIVNNDQTSLASITDINKLKDIYSVFRLSMTTYNI